MSSGNPAERTNFFQAREESIVAVNQFNLPAGGVGRRQRNAERSPQSLLDERTQRLPVPAGLLLGQAHEFVINIQYRLHGPNLGSGNRAVNHGAFRVVRRRMPPPRSGHYELRLRI